MNAVYIQQTLWCVTVMCDVWHVTSTLKRTITKSTLIWVAVLCALRRRFTPGARATSTAPTLNISQTSWLSKRASHVKYDWYINTTFGHHLDFTLLVSLDHRVCLTFHSAMLVADVSASARWQFLWQHLGPLTVWNGLTWLNSLGASGIRLGVLESDI